MDHPVQLNNRFDIRPQEQVTRDGGGARGQQRQDQSARGAAGAEDRQVGAEGEEGQLEHGARGEDPLGKAQDG